MIMKMYNCSLMIFLLAIGGLLLASCEKKEVMEYEGLDGIYFDVQYGAAHGYLQFLYCQDFVSVHINREDP